MKTTMKQYQDVVDVFKSLSLRCSTESELETIQRDGFEILSELSGGSCRHLSERDGVGDEKHMLLGVNRGGLSTRLWVSFGRLKEADEPQQESAPSGRGFKPNR